jgi:hypothetical protein
MKSIKLDGEEVLFYKNWMIRIVILPNINPPVFMEVKYPQGGTLAYNQVLTAKHFYTVEEAIEIAKGEIDLVLALDNAGISIMSTVLVMIFLLGLLAQIN